MTSPFADLTFEKFRALANNPALSAHEKVGFPDTYRAGNEARILEDISSKLRLDERSSQIVLEIGPGCSDIPVRMAVKAAERSNKVVFVDSEEMLSHLPDAENVIKLAGAFPRTEGLEVYRNRVDAVLAYSVIQYPFIEGSVFDFLDACLELLAPNGAILLGDIPNISMRKRFFSGEAGHLSHEKWGEGQTYPDTSLGIVERGLIDDSVVQALVARARAAGFHAWIVPQRRDLPMATRREDILIERP